MEEIILLVIKRNGDIVDFNKQKIIDAINAAFIEVDGKLYEDDTAYDIAYDIKYQTELFLSAKNAYGINYIDIVCEPSAQFH